jgi:hypothetical protein
VAALREYSPLQFVDLPFKPVDALLRARRLALGKRGRGRSKHDRRGRRKEGDRTQKSH